jgi:hypothetical protein
MTTSAQSSSRVEGARIGSRVVWLLASGLVAACSLLAPDDGHYLSDPSASGSGGAGSLSGGAAGVGGLASLLGSAGGTSGSHTGGAGGASTGAIGAGGLGATSLGGAGGAAGSHTGGASSGGAGGSGRAGGSSSVVAGAGGLGATSLGGATGTGGLGAPSIGGAGGASGSYSGGARSGGAGGASAGGSAFHTGGASSGSAGGLAVGAGGLGATSIGGAGGVSGSYSGGASAGSSAIVCNGNFADCNHQASDGCEVDLSSSSANCGGCGQAFACAADETCEGGACISVSGCSDGQREAFLPTSTWPHIAGCTAAWPSSSLRDPKTGGTCGLELGVCQVPADACGKGWHVCAIPPFGPTEVSTQATEEECAAQPGAFVAAVGDQICEPCTADGTGAACCGTGCVQQNGSCIYPGMTAWFGVVNGYVNLCGAIESNSAQRGVLCCRAP